MVRINRVTINGNVTREVESNYAGAAKVARFGIAHNEKIKTKDGETKENTVFVEVETWGKRAEFAEKYIEKGSALYVEGKLSFDSWEDKESGQKRQRLFIRAERIQFNAPKKDNVPEAPEEEASEDDENIPF